MSTAGYRIDLTCPRCGAPVEHVTNSAPNGYEQRAIVQCTECPTEALVTVTLVALAGDDDRRVTLARHGTEAGYRQHRRRGEVPCGACKKAHTVYNKIADARRHRERLAMSA